MQQLRCLSEIFTSSTLKPIVIFLFQVELVASTLHRNISRNHSCYTCTEPLIGYTDHSGSCKYLNTSSSLALSYRKDCYHNDSIIEYECRKLVISYRSVDTYLRRDCVPKGSCAWKDTAKSANYIPISDCVYTDERTQKLECIYCCDTPLCNRTISHRIALLSIIYLLFLSIIRTYQ